MLEEILESSCHPCGERGFFKCFLYIMNALISQCSIFLSEGVKYFKFTFCFFLNHVYLTTEIGSQEPWFKFQLNLLLRCGTRFSPVHTFFKSSWKIFIFSDSLDCVGNEQNWLILFSRGTSRPLFHVWWAALQKVFAICWYHLSAFPDLHNVPPLPSLTMSMSGSHFPSSLLC